MYLPKIGGSLVCVNSGFL